MTREIADDIVRALQKTLDYWREKTLPPGGAEIVPFDPA
jgi:hypothetical protein